MLCHTLLKSSVVSPCPKGSEQYRTRSRLVLCLTDAMVKNGEFTDPSFLSLPVSKLPTDAIQGNGQQIMATSGKVKLSEGLLLWLVCWKWLRLTEEETSGQIKTMTNPMESLLLNFVWKREESSTLATQSSLLLFSKLFLWPGSGHTGLLTTRPLHFTTLRG